jgi:hypothetical protein
MVKMVYKVAAVDLVLLALLYYVLQDLAWRAYYAGTPHVPGSPFAPSFSYSILIRYFTMAGSKVSLTSPPTLDWVQLIVLVLVAVNGWFAYNAYRSRKASIDRGTSLGSAANP